MATHKIQQNSARHSHELQHPRAKQTAIGPQRQKIQYLHKMLDNEISTVNSLFEKDNAFEQIEAKLKLLEVKLNSIKEQSSPINPNFMSNQQNNTRFNSYSIESSVVGKDKQFHSGKCMEQYELPFESLSKYKSSQKNIKKQEIIGEKSIEKSKSKRKMKNNGQQYSASAKKLNFDVQDVENKEQNHGKRILREKLKSKKKSLSRKIKSEILLPQNQSEKKLRSRNQQYDGNKSIYKTISRQNSAKKTRNSVTKSTIKPTKQCNSSIKKLSDSKTTTNLHNWKDIVNIYSQKKERAVNADNQKKQKVKQIIRQSQAKRLERQLSTYKMKNENLQNQVAQLKGYKVQFQKLKSIFEKEERIRKSRKRI